LDFLGADAVALELLVTDAVALGLLARIVTETLLGTDAVTVVGVTCVFIVLRVLARSCK